LSRWQENKKTVLEAALKMSVKGLVVGTAGNISLRLPPENGRELMAITPSSVYYDLLNVDDIPIIDFEGKSVEGVLLPSSETALHLGIYRARKNINAIIHTHSVFASAVSVTGKDIPPILDDQVMFLGGEIKIAKHALAGSKEQLPNVLAALEDRNAVLLSNHGAIGMGRNIRDAFVACELIEKTAEIFLQALAAGKINPLSARALEAEKAIFHKLQS
jgi:L-ribulose-5-phosphate 4-epimerase